MNAPRLVAVVGPTASGKSAFALEAARRFSGEIVSCDSVQVYRGLDIGSGKPSVADRRAVPHYLIDILDLPEEMNAAIFAQRASSAIGAIHGRGRLPIVAGGTGLYLTALLRGLFESGEVDPAIRSRLDRLAALRGTARLHRLLAARDPDYAARTEPNDRVRVIRALEVWFAHKTPFSRIQRERRPAFLGDALIVGLDPGRSELRERVTQRAVRMLEGGLVEETRSALSRVPTGHPMPRPLRSIGYRQVADNLSRSAPNPEADAELLRAIVTATMQYAKRQMTYFRHQFKVEWFEEREAGLDRIAAWLEGAGASAR